MVQFSLRSLLLFVAAIAIALAGWVTVYLRFDLIHLILVVAMTPFWLPLIFLLMQSVGGD